MCPACGEAPKDVFLDALMKMKHQRHAEGPDTFAADVMFVSADMVDMHTTDHVVRQ